MAGLQVRFIPDPIAKVAALHLDAGEKEKEVTAADANTSNAVTGQYLSEVQQLSGTKEDVAVLCGRIVRSVTVGATHPALANTSFHRSMSDSGIHKLFMKS